LIGYADDITYYKRLTSAEDPHDVNSDMEVICNKTDESKLKINYKKVKAMVIS